jgi:hypothetical protein
MKDIFEAYSAKSFGMRAPNNVPSSADAGFDAVQELGHDSGLSSGLSGTVDFAHFSQLDRDAQHQGTYSELQESLSNDVIVLIKSILDKSYEGGIHLTNPPILSTSSAHTPSPTVISECGDAGEFSNRGFETMEDPFCHLIKTRLG